jgi:hypothetical protein
MHRLHPARDAINLVASAIGPGRGIEHAILSQQIVDRRAAARGVTLAEDIVEMRVSRSDVLWDMAGTPGWSSDVIDLSRLAAAIGAASFDLRGGLDQAPEKERFAMCSARG